METTKPRTKRQKAEDDRRISRIYGQRCHGIQVPIMSVPKVYAKGEAALLAGGDDAAIGDALLAAAEAVRC